MSIVGPFRLKAQVMCGDEPAMGPGKALVLDAIRREGSISAAGRSLGMSYRRTWLLVDSMNRCWAERLVETGATGARLSAKGDAVLAAYRALERRLEQAALADAALLDGLLPAPRTDGVAPIAAPGA